MGFQTGSQIRPELGNADYSGFANAANIQAQALANFGQQIGEGIEKYQKNKEITGVTLASIEGTLAQNPDLIASGKAQGGKIGSLFNKLEDDGVLNKSEALMLRGFLDTSIESKLAEQAAVDAQLQRENLIARTEASRRSNRPQEPTPISASALSGITDAMTEAGIDFDPSTGQFFKKDYGSQFNPFDTTQVPVDLPVKGSEEYREIYSDPGVITFDPNKYKLLSTQ